MAQLGSTQGASLVPDLSQSLNLALQTFGTPETREAKRLEAEARQAEIDRQAAIQQQMQNVLPDPTRDPGEQRAAEEAALLRLVTLDPDIAKLTRDTLAKGDESELAALKAEAEKGARNAEFVSSQSDFAAKQRAIGVLAQDAAARGEPLDRLIELQNMNEDRLDLELQKMKLAAQDIETVLTLPKREIIEDVTGVSRFVDTGEAVFPAVVAGGIPEAGVVVKASEILPNGSVIQSTSEGVRVFDAQGNRLSGQAVVDTIELGRAMGIKVAGDTAAAKAEADKVKQSIRIAGDAFKATGNIRKTLLTITRARSAIAQGAETGVIDKLLPSIRESSIVLDNVMNQLGLEVVSGTTFGTLSAGELALALDTALPTGLQPEALDRWLVAKQDAQRKLLIELEDDILILNEGGTVADLTRKRQQQRGTDEAVTPPPGLTQEELREQKRRELLGG